MDNNSDCSNPLVYKNINKDSSLRIVFLSGLGLDIRRQREGFLRRFSLTHNVSYLALDYTKYIMQHPEYSQERIKDAFIKTKDILKNLKEEKLILLGGCFGGLMGLKIAEQLPNRISGCILFAPAYEPPTFPMISSAERLLENRIKILKKRQTDPQILNKLIVFKETVISAFKTHSTTVIKPNFQGHLSIFHGAEDKFILTENSRHIQKSLKNPHCHLHIIKKAGHSMNTDFEMKKPLRILNAFLKEYCNI